MRVSLSAIAKACSVSKMTVSRALRELDGVSPEVAAGIREKAREMGWEPDPWMTRMMTETRFQQHVEYRDTIAFVWNSWDQYGGEEYAGVRWQAEQFRFRVDEFHPLRDRISGRRLAQILEARRIRGVILSPPTDRHHPHFFLPSKGIACVLIGSSLRNKGYLRVQNDHFHTGVTAMTHLLRHGYSRPGVVMDESFYERSWRSHAAALAAFSRLPVDLKKAVMLTELTGTPGSSFNAWFRSYKPDVLLLQHWGAGNWVKSLGYRIPQDIPAALLTRWEETQGWAGIVQNSFRIGQEAMKALAFKLLSEDFGKDPMPPVIQVQGIWKDGESLPKRQRQL